MVSGKVNKLIAILMMLLAGCSVYTGNCVSDSLFQAHVMRKNGFQVRIAVMTTDDPRVLHAQAQALIDGEWRWLDSDRAMVFTGDKDAVSGDVIEYRELKEILMEVGK